MLAAMNTSLCFKSILNFWLDLNLSESQKFTWHEMKKWTKHEIKSTRHMPTYETIDFVWIENWIKIFIKSYINICHKQVLGTKDSFITASVKMLHLHSKQNKKEAQLIDNKPWQHRGIKEDANNATREKIQHEKKSNMRKANNKCLSIKYSLHWSAKVLPHRINEFQCYAFTVIFFYSFCLLMTIALKYEWLFLSFSLFLSASRLIDTV